MRVVQHAPPPLVPAPNDPPLPAPNDPPLPAPNDPPLPVTSASSAAPPTLQPAIPAVPPLFKQRNKGGGKKAGVKKRTPRKLKVHVMKQATKRL